MPSRLLASLAFSALFLTLSLARAEGDKQEKKPAAMPIEPLQDGILSIAIQPSAAPLEKILPPAILVSVKNSTSEVLKWKFLNSEISIDGKSLIAWPKWSGGVDVRWNILKPGEGFTREYSLPDNIWKNPGVKKIQWVTQARGSNTLSVSWQADASLAKEILATLAKTTDTTEVRAYLRALRLIGHEPLVTGLKDTLAPDRAPATPEAEWDDVLIAAIGITRDEKIGELAPQLTGCLKQKPPDIVSASLRALAVLPEPPAVTDVTFLAKHSDPIVRRYLAGLLGHSKIDRDQATALLHQMVRDEDTLPAKTYEEHAFVKIWAWQSLGYLGDRAGVPALIDMLEQKESESFRGNVRFVLQKITGEKFETDQEWLDWYKKSAVTAPEK